MDKIEGLLPLRDVIRQYELRAKKSLGQNFLLDLNLIDKIARAAGPLDNVNIVEIGPGPGSLTRALLAHGAKNVVAIEQDHRCVEALYPLVSQSNGRLTVIEGDAMKTDPRTYLGDGPARIVANLPYNIGTALLIDWVSEDGWPPWYDSLILMFQREVAERICASEGEEHYGRLAVLCGWRMQAEILFDIHPSAFVPPPKVTSSLVKLVPRKSPAPCNLKMLERVTAAAFGQRRKMLRQSLRSLGTDPLPLLEEAGIEPTRRAEEIPVAGFVALANALAKVKAKEPARG
jgi:16S rRNA (adenine1518-N6/adenine1519-N6)-dimethyltransferase